MEEVHKTPHGLVESMTNGKTMAGKSKADSSIEHKSNSSSKSPLDVMVGKISGRSVKKSLYNTRRSLDGHSSPKPGNQLKSSTKPVPKKPSSSDQNPLTCKKCHLPIDNPLELKTHSCFFHHCSICSSAFKNSTLLERHVTKRHTKDTGKSQSVEFAKPSNGLPMNTEKPSTSSSTSSINNGSKKRKLRCINCNLVLTSELEKMFCMDCSKLDRHRPPEVPKKVKKIVPSTKKTTVPSRKEKTKQVPKSANGEVKKKRRRVVRKKDTLESKPYQVDYSEKINYRCHKCYYGSITKVMFEDHFKQDCAKRIKTMTQCVVSIKRLTFIKQEDGVDNAPTVTPISKPITCRLCKETFPSMESYNFHVEYKHSTMLTPADDTNRCAICWTRFQTSVALQLHECNPPRLPLLTNDPPASPAPNPNSVTMSVSHQQSLSTYPSDSVNTDVEESLPTVQMTPSTCPDEVTQSPFEEQNYAEATPTSTIPESLEKDGEGSNNDDQSNLQDNEKDTNECGLKIGGVRSLSTIEDANLEDAADNNENNSPNDNPDDAAEDGPRYICMSQSCYQSVGSEDRHQHFEDNHGHAAEETDIADNFLPLQE